MLTHGHASPCPPPRVVLLGRNGFVGASLARMLSSQAIPVKALGSRDVDLTSDTAHEELTQILRPDDTVVFASAITSDRRRDFSAFMDNVRMAEQVCLALQRCPVAHVVYLSSDAVYDAHQIPLDEDSTREPLSLYALTHTAREMMLRDELDNLGVPLCVLRPTSIYGPGDTHRNYGPNRFTRSALSEKKIVLYGQGEERRSHVYIDDALRLISGSILHRSTGTLNLAHKPAVSYRHVAEMVMAACPHPVKIEFQPRQVPPVHRPYKPTQIFRFIYNLGRPIGPIVHRPYAIGAITQAFPEFVYTPLANGISRFMRALGEETSSPVSTAP